MNSLIKAQSMQTPQEDRHLENNLHSGKLHMRERNPEVSKK